MSHFEELYDAFKLDPAQRETLLKLADKGSLGTPQSTRLMVETVVINGGEKIIVSRENVCPTGQNCSRR